MKIGYLTLGMETNFLNKESFDMSWGVRVPVVKSILDQGHDIVVLSPMSRIDERYKKYKTLRKPPEWFQKLEYRFKPSFDRHDLDDLDLLFIECGPTNTVFGRGDVSYFEVVSNALNLWEGKVVYYQHAPVLFYPFGEWFNEEPIKKNISDKNLRLQVMRSRVFENKEWLIVHHARNEDLWIDKMYCRHGMTYRDIKDRVGEQLKFRYIPLPYDKSEGRCGPATGEKWDSIFIGGRYTSSSMNYVKKDTDRYPMLYRFYYRAKFRYAIIGKNWDGVKDLNVLGPVGKPSESSKIYNKSFVSIWTDSKFAMDIEWFSSRYLFILLGGCLLVADTEHKLACDYVDREFHISDQKDLEELIYWYKNLSVNEREELRIKQEHKFPSWSDIDWKRIFKF